MLVAGKIYKKSHSFLLAKFQRHLDNLMKREKLAISSLITQVIQVSLKFRQKE